MAPIPTGHVTHLLNVAGHKYHIDTARSQLVEDQEDVHYVAETQKCSGKQCSFRGRVLCIPCSAASIKQKEHSPCIWGEFLEDSGALLHCSGRGVGVIEAGDPPPSAQL